MDIFVYDTNMNILGVIDNFQSFIWTRRYWECGEMKLFAPYTENHIKLLQQGNMIMKSGGHEVAQIAYINIKQDIQGKDQIEVQGKFIASWLKRRIVVKPVVVSATTQTIINRLVSENITAASVVARRIPNLAIETVAGVGGGVIQYANEDQVDVLTAVENAAMAAKLGFMVRTDPTTGQHYFRVYKGRDLTYQNTAGNPPCVFSQEFDNVLEHEYTSSTENLRTYAYVRGEKVNNVPPKNAEVGTGTGLDRLELFVDGSDIQQSSENAAGNTVTMTDTQYINALKQRANEELEYHTESLSFSSVINPESNLKYMVDFDLGDRVTCRDRRWGVTIDVRITEVIETFEKGKNGDLEVTFGEGLPTRLDRILKAK
jgi:hypothetical protein